ncbi:MAG: hypothetical protein ACRDOL_22010, partial [Streptosporangiaceae bacterium]
VYVLLLRHQRHIQELKEAIMAATDITLCRRCHVKLRPHFQPHLYRSLPGGNDFLDFDMHDQQLLEGVRLYQEQVSYLDLD